MVKRMIVCGNTRNGGNMIPEIEEYIVQVRCEVGRCAKCSGPFLFGERVVVDNLEGWQFHKECE